jgi:predicted DNA-binding transcriptional regulator YafY
MRADRLLSILMLLQSRGRVTAPELAREMEVSVRTIYRDIEALSTAGVPVYAERGPGGGCVLMEGYRSGLTGLTPNEVKALFIMSVPESLDKLGVSGELRTALRKLAAALPSGRPRGEDMAGQRIYLDWKDWSQVEKPAPHLQTIHQAVRDSQNLLITYTATIAGGKVGKFERLVDPYGLVAKSGEWHLVCADSGHMHVYCVSEIIEARPKGGDFTRPDNFNLAAFWKNWCKEQDQERPVYLVKARIAPGLAALMLIHMGERFREAIQKAGPPDAEGWIPAELTFNSFWESRMNILNMGRDIEILEPEPLRLSVIDFAEQIKVFYAAKNINVKSF